MSKSLTLELKNDYLTDIQITKELTSDDEIIGYRTEKYQRIKTDEYMRITYASNIDGKPLSDEENAHDLVRGHGKFEYIKAEAVHDMLKELKYDAAISTITFHSKDTTKRCKGADLDKARGDIDWIAGQQEAILMISAGTNIKQHYISEAVHNIAKGRNITN